MTTPKLLVLIILSFLCNVTSAQTQLTQKQHLLAAIKESIRDDYSLNRTWTGCNGDSAFSKADTIRLYNNKNYQSGIGCCNYINWKFINETSYKQNKSFPCTEPPGESVHFDKSNLYTVKIAETNNTLYLQTYRAGRLEDSFKVLSIKNVKMHNGELTNELTLLRVN
jgi:hypothetical protein